MNPFFIRILQQTLMTVGAVVGKSFWDAYRTHASRINAGAAGTTPQMLNAAPAPMTQPEACKILGLGIVPDGKRLSVEDLKKADENYMRLMRSNETKDDRPGSVYLQAKLYHAHQHLRTKSTASS
eukprot:GGOE01049283.1.p1 GENE.GGOE01049283.1~~GGOE01049283.1.p1  ORF type:complete len:146 (+),score=24.69 GGOE01049283.1:64-438(+)